MRLPSPPPTSTRFSIDENESRQHCGVVDSYKIRHCLVKDFGVLGMLGFILEDADTEDMIEGSLARANGIYQVAPCLVISSPKTRIA